MHRFPCWVCGPFRNPQLCLDQLSSRPSVSDFEWLLCAQDALGAGADAGAGAGAGGASASARAGAGAEGEGQRNTELRRWAGLRSPRVHSN